MQYIYDVDAGKNNLTLRQDLYKYIVKVRRFKVGSFLYLRNLKDNYLYIYKIEKITKKEVFLSLFEKIFDERNLEKSFEIFWCIIDVKVIEKTLPILNQLGVNSITFIYCDRSQKNFKIDLERFRKIVINSNQQCGRVDIMKFNIVNSLDEIIEKHNNIYLLDFGGEVEFDTKKVKKVLIGCEGGFSDIEREKLSKYKKISFNTKNILKSETAVIAITSKIIA